jgi:hypothetical protein
LNAVLATMVIHAINTWGDGDSEPPSAERGAATLSQSFSAITSELSNLSACRPAASPQRQLQPTHDGSYDAACQLQALLFTSLDRDAYAGDCTVSAFKRWLGEIVRRTAPTFGRDLENTALPSDPCADPR